MICRLCGSSTNLISMFNGKSKTLRNYLRKVIEDTVHIHIQPFDNYNLVCINCCLDAANFFFFKAHCSGIQEKLMIQKTSIYNPKRQKTECDLFELEEPDLHNIEDILAWLSRKRNKIHSNNNITKSSQTEVLNCKSDVHQATQTTPVNSLIYTDKDVQTENTILLDTDDPTSPASAYNSKCIVYLNKVSLNNVEGECETLPVASSDQSKKQLSGYKRKSLRSSLRNQKKIEKSTMCKICNITFSNENEFGEHYKIHQQCNWCKKIFKNAQMARNHTKKCALRAE